jgi:hypothetical protein
LAHHRTFVEKVPPDELEHGHYSWDTDGTLDDALTLTRLIRDNGYSTEYAARLLDYEDGQCCIIYVLHREDKAIWRLCRDREQAAPTAQEFRVKPKRSR